MISPQQIDERYRLPQGYEALRRLVGPDVKRFLKLIGYSGKNHSNFYKFCEPHGGPCDSGLPSPLDQLNKWIRTAILDGRALGDALAPLYWLCFQHDLAAIPLPPTDASREIKDIINEFLEHQKESSHVTQVFCDRILSDGEVSPADAKEMAMHIQHSIVQLLILNQAIQEAVQ